MFENSAVVQWAAKVCIDISMTSLEKGVVILVRRCDLDSDMEPTLEMCGPAVCFLPSGDPGCGTSYMEVC